MPCVISHNPFALQKGRTVSSSQSPRYHPSYSRSPRVSLDGKNSVNEDEVKVHWGSEHTRRFRAEPNDDGINPGSEFLIFGA